MPADFGFVSADFGVVLELPKTRDWWLGKMMNNKIW
jgi:hypothetical protein